jgi:hypothetical protein
MDMYEIIYHDQIKPVLEREFTNVKDNLQVISAYCTTNALAYVDSIIHNAPSAKKIMVRFHLDDILNGATDFSIYEYCKKHNWDVYIKLDLHAKTFIFDKKRWIVGSANLTSRGIGLINNSNMEMAVLADVDENEFEKINALFNAATLLTDDIYELMTDQLGNKTFENNNKSTWDIDILDLLNNKIVTVFTHDFVKSQSPNHLLDDDYELLQLSKGKIDKNELRSSFITTIGFKWLVQTLKSANNQQLYFGNITVLLHKALVNDPRPYRKEVKDLLVNLLSWIQELDIDNVKIERPNHSQLISLVSSRLHEVIS